MARPIKFALEMKDGVKVRRTLDEIREHFDMTKATEHFVSGQLVKWLDDRGYEDETERLRSLDSHSPDFSHQLCEILGVPYNGGDDVDMDAVAKLNDKRNLLRQKTSDEEMIAHAAETAFTQHELLELLDGDASVIYLCGDEFSIPAHVKGKKFVGVGKKPKVTLDVKSQEELAAKRLVFENVDLPESLRQRPAKPSASKKTEPVQGSKTSYVDKPQSVKTEIPNATEGTTPVKEYPVCPGVQLRDALEDYERITGKPYPYDL